MTERSRRIMYRLYGLAECTYFFVTNRNNEDVESSLVLTDKKIIVHEEPEDNDGDEWTMFEKDYKAIREVMEVYDDNMDWVTIADMTEVEDEN